MIAIEADRVRAGIGAGQIEFLELFGFGIKAADLISGALAEPHDVVLVNLETLGFALGGWIELGKFSILRNAADGTVIAERRKPLVAIVAGDITVGSAQIKMLELLGYRIEH